MQTLAWTGAKRHQELARTYGRMAESLLLLRDRLDACRDAETPADRFGRLVDGVEQLLSRENAAWTLRRGIDR